MQPFKLLKYNCSNSFKDFEIPIKGYGIVALKTVPGLTIKIDDKLNDPIPLERFEGAFRFEFEKIYISAPAINDEIELYLMTHQTAYIDVNTNFEKTVKALDFFNKNNNLIAIRGNDFDYQEITEQKAFTRDSENPPIIYFHVEGDLTNWKITAQTKNKNGDIYKNYPESILQNNGVSLSLNGLVFTPLEGAAAIKVYVEYLIT